MQNDPVSFILYSWGVIGLMVAIAFLLLGFDRVDSGAKDAYAVRPLLVPGLVLLWPVVLWRWAILAKER